MSFDPCDWTENLMKEYMLVIEGFFSIPLPIFSSTYRKAIQVCIDTPIQLYVCMYSLALT